MLRPYVAQQPVRDLVHGAVAADGHDPVRPLARRARGELDAVAGTLGPLDVDRPAVALELARDGIERATRRAAGRGGIEDDVGVDQRLFRYPFASSSSALRIAAPAAPRMVLWLSATKRWPNTASRAMRPTVTLIPRPASRSRRGCGRSGSSRTRMGRSAGSAARPSFTRTAARWPSTTLTR